MIRYPSDDGAVRAEVSRYEDDDLTISPQQARSDGPGSLLTIMPVTFEPVFTGLALAEDDKRFKADVSFRGVLRDGIEIELSTPYALGLWIPGQSREVFVMDPAEALAEKLLGWAVHQETKHFADAAWITHQAWVVRSEHFRFTGMQIKELLAAKLEAMRKVQPNKYADFPTVDAVIHRLGQPASLPQTDWNKLVYLKDERTRWTQRELRALIAEKLMPQLRAAGR